MTIQSMHDARMLADAYLAALPAYPPIDLAIADSETIECDFGWVFFWTSKEYLETRDASSALAGNGPLIVDRRDGSVHEISTEVPIDESINRYRRTGSVR